MRVCVVGLGYVGLPTACLFAQSGYQVTGVDTNPAVVKRIENVGDQPLAEQGLSKILQNVLASGSLRISTSPKEADVFIICVPTPLTSGGSVSMPETPVRNGSAHGDSVAPLMSELEMAAAGQLIQQSEFITGPSLVHTEWNGPSVDLSHVEAAIRATAPLLRTGNLVVVESTIPPGTTNEFVLKILESFGWDKHEIRLAHAPERVLPGAVMEEIIGNDRVIGGVTRDATSSAVALYRNLIKGQIYRTDAMTAEFVKLIENIYRDVNIALANELAVVAEFLGINIHEAISLANRHPRVDILKPGPGVGGHCIPIDPYFIMQQAPALTRLTKTARIINDSMVQYTVTAVKELSRRQNLQQWVILGASYKANIADERNSPSFPIARKLKDAGLQVRVHDPFIDRFNLPLEAILEQVDGILILTDHTFYRELDPSLIASRVRHRFLIDTRGCIVPEKWEASGFVVKRLGDGRR